MSTGLSALWETIKGRGRGDFLVQPGARTSYKALRQRIETACAFFDEHGLAPGDRLTIALADEMAASATFLAALLDGLVPVMLSPEASHARRAAIADRVTARLVVDADMPPPEPGGLLRSLPGLGRGRAPATRPPRLPDLAPDHTAYILFTSGSTAHPRGVEITHGNLFSQMATLVRLFGYDPTSRIFNATPLSHTDGLVQGPVLAAVAGAALLRPGRFEVGRLEPWLDFLRSETATHMIANPTMLSILHRLAPETDYFAPARFKGILSTGGILTEQLWQAVEDRFDVPVWNVYGMTETVADALYAGDHPEMGARGTIGCPVDCAARVAGGAEEGELELSGPNITPGYWNDPEQTGETRTADGWFRTGDIVRRRPDGSYDFLGRAKAVINQGAVRIHPEEINEALSTHPGILEAVTVGLPDPDFEEIAVSAVVASVPVQPNDLMARCSAMLEPLKRPKHVIVLDAIPRTETSKADLNALKHALTEKLSPRGSGTAIDSPVADRVISIAAAVFGQPETAITWQATADDIPGWDSFNHLKLMMEVEEVLGVSLSTEQIVSIRTIGALVEAVAPQLDDRP